MPFEHRLHGGAHRAEVHREVGGVGDEAALGVEHGAAEVQALLDVHRDGGVGEGRAHLLGDGHEQAVEDLEQHGGDARGVGGGAGRRRGPAQQQLAAGQHLGPPARLDDGRAGGLADDRRPLDDGGRRQVVAHEHRRLVPAAAGEDARRRARGATAGRPAGRSGRSFAGAAVRPSTRRVRARGARLGVHALARAHRLDGDGLQREAAAGHQEAVAGVVLLQKRGGHLVRERPRAPAARRRCRGT